MSLSPAEYIQSVLRTANIAGTTEDVLTNTTFGIQGETGELIDLAKKVYFQGHPINPEKVISEVGDILFYVFWMIQVTDSIHHLIHRVNKYDVYSSEIDWWSNISAIAENKKILHHFTVMPPLRLISPNAGNPIRCIAGVGLQFSVFVTECYRSISDRTIHLNHYQMERMLKYLVDFLTIFGIQIPLSEIAEINKIKLEDRYPDKFSTEASINRRN